MSFDRHDLTERYSLELHSFLFSLNLTVLTSYLCGMTPAGRSEEYFQDILEEPEVLRDSKCQEIVRKARDYFQMCYEKKLNYWTQNTKPSRWPQLLAALSYAEVRLNKENILVDPDFNKYFGYLIGIFRAFNC